MTRQAGSRNPTHSPHLSQAARRRVFRWCLGAWMALPLSSVQHLFADDNSLRAELTTAKSGRVAAGTVELAAEIPLHREAVAAAGRPLSTIALSATDTITPVGTPQFDGRYVACLAAQNDGSADLLRRRGRTLIHLYCDQKECSQAVASAVAAALERQAQRQEDIAAANGLRAYYTRIAIAEQLRLVHDSQQQLESAEAKQLALSEQGIAPGGDLSAFARQSLEIADQRLQLASQDRQLGGLLQQLTKQSWDSQSVHVEQLDVRPQEVDRAGLAAIALLQRSDLQAWRLLRRAVNTETAPELTRMLSAVNGGWSIPLPQLGPLQKLLCASGNARLAANVADEMQRVEALLGESIQQSVAERCEKLQLGYQRMALAKDTMASWQGRLEQFIALEEQGEVRPELRSQAVAGLLEARGVEIQRRLEARLAEVDLAEAIGGLADRCCRGEAWLGIR